MAWISEVPPVWDAEKDTIIGGAPPGAIDVGNPPPSVGDQLQNRWWRWEDTPGHVVGFGWLTESDGDIEASVAVATASQGSGVGRSILRRLEQEAVALGYTSMLGVVRFENPLKEAVVRWLFADGYRAYIASLEQSEQASIQLVRRGAVEMWRDIP